MIKLFIPFIKSNKNWYENVTAEGNQVQFGLIISKTKLFPRYFFFPKLLFSFIFTVQQLAVILANLFFSLKTSF